MTFPDTMAIGCGCRVTGVRNGLSAVGRESGSMDTGSTVRDQLLKHAAIKRQINIEFQTSGRARSGSAIFGGD